MPQSSSNLQTQDSIATRPVLTVHWCRIVQYRCDDPKCERKVEEKEQKCKQRAPCGVKARDQPVLKKQVKCCACINNGHSAEVRRLVANKEARIAQENSMLVDAKHLSGNSRQAQLNEQIKESLAQIQKNHTESLKGAEKDLQERLEEREEEVRKYLSNLDLKAS